MCIRGGNMKSNSKTIVIWLAALFLQSCNGGFKSSEAENSSISNTNSYGQNSSNEFAVGGRPPTVQPRQPAQVSPSPTTTPNPVETLPIETLTPPVLPIAPIRPIQPVQPVQPVLPVPPIQPIVQFPAPIQNPPAVTPVEPPPPPLPICPGPPEPGIGSAATTFNCAADLQAMNWVNLNSQEKVKISLNPIDNYWREQDGYPNETFAYGAIGVSFQNPYRAGSNNYFRHAPQFRAEGYSIRIRDNVTGAVVEAQDSDLTRPHVWSASGQAVMGFIKGVANDTDSSGRQQNNSLGFHFSRSLYDKIKNFNTATVSLHCNNALVAEGQQDVQSLQVNMSQRMVKVGTLQGTGLYSFPANEIFGYINVNCPIEINAGSNAQCSGGGLHISGGYWLIDGQVASQFTGANSSSVALSLSSLSRGSHNVQIVVTYTNGKTDKSNIFLVKVK